MKSSNRYAQQFKASRDGAKAEFGRAERQLPNGEVHLDFNAAKEWLSALPPEQLRYIMKDAREAANAMPDGKKFNYYHDLALTAGDILRKRMNASRPGAKKKNDLTEACWEGYEAVGTKKKDGKTVPNCVPMSRPGEADAFALGAASEATRPEQDEALTALAAKVGREHTVSLFKRWSEGKASMSRQPEQV